ncbi:hypothetical protein ATG70_1615 [Bacillus sp. es.036]|nr:hypothetical protein ATG70_1615 [Bacillus sp. es.036]
MWDKRFVPGYDLFFFKQEPREFKVISRKEGYDTLSLDERTSFLTWNVHHEAEWIAKVSNELFLSLDKDKQQKLLLSQVEYGRGYYFKYKDLLTLDSDPATVAILDDCCLMYKKEKIVVFQGWSWRQLPLSFRFKLLEMISRNFVSSSSLKVGEEMGSSELINTFISSNGPNCFSFTLMNLDKEAAQTYTKTWVKEKEFLSLLNSYGYHAKARNHVTPQDVLVWFQNNQAVHGCYAISGAHVLNKNGQTMFHPYQCLPLSDVMNTWKSSTLVIYSK